MISPSPFLFRKSLAPQQLGRKAIPNSRWEEQELQERFRQLRYTIVDEFFNLMGNAAYDQPASDVSYAMVHTQNPKELLDIVYRIRSENPNAFGLNVWIRELNRLQELGLGQRKFLQQEPPHKFACLMARPDESLVRQIKEWTEKIPDEHLGKGGRESDPHVTIKFGFQDDSVEVFDALTAIVQSKGPIEGKLQGLEVFSPNEDGDVLHVKVQSKMLIDLNKELSEKFACVDTHPDYKPHLTLAYLNPEFTTLYEKSDVPFLNQDVVFGTAVWSNRYRNTTVIPLYKQGMGQLGQKTLRSKEPLFRELLFDQAWDVLHDAVLEALEEEGYDPELRESTANGFVNTARMNFFRYNYPGMSQAFEIVSRLTAGLDYNLQQQRNLHKDLSAFNNNLGGALVPPPAFAGRKPIAPSPFRKRVMKGKV